MAATRYQEIRERQLERIRAIAPVILPALPFRAWEGNDPDFGEWADGAGEAFRVFDIGSNHDYQLAVYLGEGVNDVAHTETVLVSYPRLAEYSGQRLELVIDQDIHDLNAAIGQGAYADYVDGQHNCRIDGTAIVDRQAVRILRVIFRLEYHRSVPT